MKFNEKAWLGRYKTAAGRVKLGRRVACALLEERLIGFLPVVIHVSDCGYGPGVVCASREIAEHLVRSVSSEPPNRVPGGWSQVKTVSLLSHAHLGLRLAITRDLGFAVCDPGKPTPIDTGVPHPYVASIAEVDELLSTSDWLRQN